MNIWMILKIIAALQPQQQGCWPSSNLRQLTGLLA